MRTLCLLFLMFIYGFAFEVKPTKLTIQEVDKKKQTLILTPSKTTEFYAGETGIIVHKIGAGIISNLITITEVTQDKIYATYEHFKLLEQKYLPTPIIEPKIGDEVVMRSLYSRAFIVAPNQKLYDTIKAEFPNINFVSSDLMIADVGDKGIIDPSKKAFQQVCTIYSVGLLMIYASNGLNILDCQSFKVLQTQPLQNPSPKEKSSYPFFARVEAKSFWDFLRRKKDYFKEYDKLLK